MSEEDFMEMLADDTADLSEAPTDKSLEGVASCCTLLLEADETIRSLEANLSDVKATRFRLAHQTIPDLFNELDMSNFGLDSAGVDIVKEDYAKAGISKEWEEERRDKGFAHLESLGGGDLVKSELVINAGKGDLEALREALPELEAVLKAAEIETSIRLDLSVHWGSLTSFVKAENAKGTKMELDLLGATVGEIVKIKKRKV